MLVVLYSIPGSLKRREILKLALTVLSMIDGGIVYKKNILTNVMIQFFVGLSTVSIFIE